jgi:hypothetical protein
MEDFIMYLDELYEYFGSYSDMSRELGLGYTTYSNWKRKGFIPYRMQCVIENKTNRRFKADKNHTAPKK